MILAKNTASILEEYIGSILEDNGFSPQYCAFQMEMTFGKDIHQKVDGFIRFAKQHPDKIDLDGIMTTLVHDVAGALKGDRLMLPRVSGYIDHKVLKK